MEKDKSKAFTLAEILLSLSIIGIVAAIALPSLLGNVNERAFETQKKALYTRFSQALPLLPSLNGYGEVDGTLSDGENEQSVTTDTAAESFIRDGLSKVMKVNNICAVPEGKTGADAAKYLTDCGFPDKIIGVNGSTSIMLSDIYSLGTLNPIMKKVTYDGTTYEILDTKAAAFETVNGESVLVYYNPNCEPDYKETISYLAQPKMCANFVYDLNGKKGPNTVGKDIGIITALYAMSPLVVTVNPTKNGGSGSYNSMVQKCKQYNSEYKVPTIDELTMMFYNMTLLNMGLGRYCSSTYYSSTKNLCISTTHGNRYSYDKTNTSSTYKCVKR